MALNYREIDIILGLIKSFSEPPSVLCLGYPDILIPPEMWPKEWITVPTRTIANWIDHGKPEHQGKPMLMAKSLLKSLGASQVTVYDIAGERDYTVDLNYPTRRIGFDIIIDPGTLEHCFNISQALVNVNQLLHVGGFVYHQAAIAYPNHGFWSISPIAFYKFYEMRGYQQERCFRMIKGEGDYVYLIDMPDPPDNILHAPMPVVGGYVFKKTTDKSVTGFPQQYP